MLRVVGRGKGAGRLRVEGWSDEALTMALHRNSMTGNVREGEMQVNRVIDAMTAACEQGACKGRHICALLKAALGERRKQAAQHNLNLCYPSCSVTSSNLTSEPL